MSSGANLLRHHGHSSDDTPDDDQKYHWTAVASSKKMLKQMMSSRFRKKTKHQSRPRERKRAAPMVIGTGGSEPKTVHGSAAGNLLSSLLQREDAGPRPTMSGVVTVYVKGAQNLPSQGLSYNMFVSVFVRSLSKSTRVVEHRGRPVWNQLLHIPVTIAPDRAHPFNWLRFSLTRFDPSLPDSRVVVGSTSFHLHDVVKASPVEGVYELMQGDIVTGELELTLLFNYGFYGYGYSAQYPMKTAADKQVRSSLFPRAEPPPDRVETKRCTMVPRAVAHPSIIPFNQRAVVGYGKELAATGTDIPQTELPQLQQRMKRLSDLKKTLNTIPDRAARLEYLNSQLLSVSAPQECFVTQADAQPVLGLGNEFVSEDQSDNDIPDPALHTHRQLPFYRFLQPAKLLRKAYEQSEMERVRDHRPVARPLGDHRSSASGRPQRMPTHSTTLGTSYGSWASPLRANTQTSMASQPQQHKHHHNKQQHNSKSHRWALDSNDIAGHGSMDKVLAVDSGDVRAGVASLLAAHIPEDPPEPRQPPEHTGFLGADTLRSLPVVGALIHSSSDTGTDASAQDESRGTSPSTQSEHDEPMGAADPHDTELDGAAIDTSRVMEVVEAQPYSSSSRGQRVSWSAHKSLQTHLSAVQEESEVGPHGVSPSGSSPSHSPLPSLPITPRYSRDHASGRTASVGFSFDEHKSQEDTQQQLQQPVTPRRRRRSVYAPRRVSLIPE